MFKRSAWRYAVAASLLLGGCASLQAPEQEVQSFQQAFDKAVDLPNTPFVEQNDDLCGPAALAMVLPAAGANPSLQSLIEQVYLPGRQGSLQVEMLTAVRRQGLLPVVMQGQPTQLAKALQSGQAVVVLLNLGLPRLPRWHYAVVVGVQQQPARVVLRSGLKPREEMTLHQFMNVWNRSGYWALTVHNPNQAVPAWAAAKPWLDALVGLELVQARQAEPAYLKATQHWPQDALFWFGLGNARARQTKWQPAAQAYAKAVELQPDFADAWNNLAESQWELGQKNKARASIDKAIELGGTRKSLYLESKRRMVK